MDGTGRHGRIARGRGCHAARDRRRGAIPIAGDRSSRIRFGGGDAFYDSLVEHVQAFLEHVAEGSEPPVTGRDGLAGLQLAEAAIESLQSGPSRRGTRNMTDDQPRRSST